MSTRLIVKNLPSSADDKRLRQHFQAMGEITDIKLLRTREGRSRCVAFVGYKDAKQTEAAQRYYDRSCMGGSRLSVSFADAYGPLRPGHLSSKGSDQQRDVDHNQAHDDAPEKGKGALLDSKLNEFLGIMKPKSKLKTFANEETPYSSKPSVALPAHDGPLVNNQAPESPKGSSIESAEAEDDNVVMNDDISDLEYLKSRMRRFDSGAQVRNAEQDAPEAQSPIQHDVQAEQAEPDSLTSIRQTSRLFLRNLPFTASDEDVRELMQGFGQLIECRVVKGQGGKVSKGYALVQFSFPMDAVSAFEALDGTAFQGRLLHVLPGKLRNPELLDASTAKTTSYKQAKETERKARAGETTAWSTFYMREDTVAEAVADLLGISKAELLDPNAPDTAVRMALGETQVLAATKEELAASGVHVPLLEAAAQQSGHSARAQGVQRSKTVLILKNLPFQATEAAVRELFERTGGCLRVILPRTRALALVEMADEQTASNAFKRLAYKRFLHVPLYLEYAPDGVLDSTAKTVAATPKGAQASEAAPAPHHEELFKEFAEPGAAVADSSTLYIKNLSFDTSAAALQKRCRQAAAAVGGVLRSVNMPQKKGPEGQSLMQGYAFAEFNDGATAKAVMKKLNGALVDGHKLIVQVSLKTTKDGARGAAKRSRDGKSETKLMVRNLAFEATSKDVRQLMEAFGHVKTCRLPKKFDGSTRGFAFVEYATKGEAKKAMESAHGAHLYGRRLLLEYAQGEEGLDEPRSKVANIQ